MIVETPKKYRHIHEEYKNEEVRRSYQMIIDSLLDFKEENPHVTEAELCIYTNGIISGRTKQKSNRRK